ncbi:23S rRNA (adenine(2030)-N(6))-methyltransferase RlmJ [Aurantimonas sp. Leaf443]|uniref:23S rRNA (adenine(2030)-N(6))-methyltransferase RlmJ n=1 Tax=Aurantimonas sp. Leaf443 TaxID=1736378 RepID=UPI0007005C5F|nr:23S rRNA (adenine(2030)-N(6))-methyltransferase RlmJ [Aurantimonas sp. Leaf443]KQT88417.1 lactate dehydrogenase [Aurantimonas sp. Leaf443]
MNYRHAYHAGNFADVVKHALLSRLIAYLKRKDKAFRVVDTHAGPGLYDLSGEEATRTRESAEGIERLLGDDGLGTAEIGTDPLLRPYLDCVLADLTERRYPGSPLIARRLLRPQDRLSAYELHPQDGARLKALFSGDIQTKTFALDGWLALGAHLPPKEKRGLVLIDPPFERPDEIEAIRAGLAAALRRWPGGTYALWYPLKRPAAREALLEALATLGAGETVVTEFFVEPYSPDERFVGTGLAVLNPPFVFAQEAGEILKKLRALLGRNPGATYDVFPSLDAARAADKPARRARVGA